MSIEQDVCTSADKAKGGEHAVGLCPSDSLNPASTFPPEPDPTPTGARAAGEDDASVYTLAVLFHNAYEQAAKGAGWQTQHSCRVEFDDLPEANRKTMLATCRIVGAALAAAPDPATIRREVLLEAAKVAESYGFVWSGTKDAAETIGRAIRTLAGEPTP